MLLLVSFSHPDNTKLKAAFCVNMSLQSDELLFNDTVGSSAESILLKVNSLLCFIVIFVVVPFLLSKAFNTFSVPILPSDPTVSNFCFLTLDGGEASEEEVDDDDDDRFLEDVAVARAGFCVVDETVVAIGAAVVVVAGAEVDSEPVHL